MYAPKAKLNEIWSGTSTERRDHERNDLPCVGAELAEHMPAGPRPDRVWPSPPPPPQAPNLIQIHSSLEWASMRRVRASWAYVPPPDHIEIWSKASASRSHDKPYSNTFGASAQTICWTWIETLFRYGHKNAPVNALAKSALPGAECVVCFPFSVVPVPCVFLFFLCFSPRPPFLPLCFPDRKIWRRQAFDDSTTHSYRFQSAPDFQNWFPDEKSNGVSKEKITNTPQTTQGGTRSLRCRQCQ